MPDQFAPHLTHLWSLGVNSAVRLLRRSFDEYFHANRAIPLDDIDRFVQNIGDMRLAELWAHQRRMKYPHAFLWTMFDYHKRQTLRHSLYSTKINTAVSATRVITGSESADPIVLEINRVVSRLPFNIVVAFLCNLTDAWMRTCPERTIRREGILEKIGDRQVGHPTDEWEVPSVWIEFVYGQNRSALPGAPELKLLFALDTYIRFGISDYDEFNVVNPASA